jgi:peptide/nickel transport system permease protein
VALVGATTVFAFVIGTLLGVYAGWHRGKLADSSVTIGATFFGAFPPFWLALLLLYWLSFKYGWFPIKGGYSPGLTPNWSLSFLGNALDHSVLPALTLAITRHAQQHDQHAGRGLRDLRRGQRPAQQDGRSAVRGA